MLYTHARHRGFTLVELMVVIAIISILASFTAPSFEKHIAKANLVEVLMVSSNLTGAIDEHILLHSNFPDTSELSNLLPAQLPTDKIKSIASSKVDSKQGSITITLKSAIGIDDGQYLRYSRNSLGAWHCGTTLTKTVSPESCDVVEVASES